MTVKNFIDRVCGDRELSIREFAKKLGMQEQTLYSILKRKDGMTVPLKKLIDWLNKMDMQLVVYGFDGSEHVIDGEDETIN